MPRRLLIGLLFGILSYGLAAFLHAQGLSTSAGVVLVVPIITFVGFYVGTTGAIFGSTVLLLLYAIYLLPDSPYEGVDAVTLLFGICLVYLVISLLSGRARRVTVEARDRERRQRTLRGLGDRLTGAQGVERVCHEIITTLHEHLELPAMILILDDDREKPQLVRAPKRSDDLLRTDDDVARLLAAEQELQRGSAVATATGIAYPLLAAGTLLGALVVERSDEELRSGNEEILGAVIVTTSIALEREQLAAQAMQADLFRKHEELYGALLSSISHDFRTPLSAISGAAETLAMPLADMTEEMRQELIAMIREESDRLNRFVANLLDMTKLASGRLGLRTERIDMTDVVGTAIGHLRRHDFAHTVEVDLDEKMPLVSADFVLIEHVLVNLLENGMKYAPDDSTIRVEGEAAEGIVTIRVIDEGPGIPKKEIAKVFEKFYRVRQGDAVAAGTGLGLSICRGIITAHGGTIEAVSPVRSDGGGTMMIITLPIDRPSETTPAEPATNRE